MDRTITYENGLRLIVSEMPAVRSVAVGFWVGVGSALETDETNGISHFTEHVMFKGTADMTPFEIAGKFENYGSSVNAFTSKECTCYYVKTIDEYTEQCFSLLSHIFFRSVFPAEELDKERKVIVEEINMSEDSPEDICYDAVSEAAYGNVGLGRTVLGPAENVMRFVKSDVDKFVGEFYVPGNVVVSFAGNISLAAADELVKKYVLGCFASSAEITRKVPNGLKKRTFVKKIKTFEQVNLALSFPSLSAADPAIFVQAAMNVALGGGMSSRLFQSLRERQGLAYSVYSSPATHSGAGTFEIFLNISGQNTVRALEATRKEIDLFKKEGISDEELERAKVQLKSALVFSGENVQSVMSSAGKLMLQQNKVYDVGERIRLIDAVKRDEVNALAAAVFDYSAMNAAYVGKKTAADVMGIFEE